MLTPRWHNLVLRKYLWVADAWKFISKSTIELVSARISRFKYKGTSDALINPVQPQIDKKLKVSLGEVRVSAYFIYI